MRQRSNGKREDFTLLHPRYRYIAKVMNTFLYTPYWYSKRVMDVGYWAELTRRTVSRKAASTILGKILNRLRRYFGIQMGYIARWANQSVGGEDDPRSFVEMDPPSDVLIEDIANRASSLDVPILDLGCNCGRHLHALMKLGFTKLYGVDIGRGALDYMDEVFPGLSEHAQITCASFQQYLLQTPDRFFEILYTFGATVQLVHPAFPLVKELTRVTRGHVILCIQENLHTYPRFWTYEFQREGFVLVKLLRPAIALSPGSSPSLLAYRRCVLNES